MLRSHFLRTHSRVISSVKNSSTPPCLIHPYQFFNRDLIVSTTLVFLLVKIMTYITLNKNQLFMDAAQHGNVLYVLHNHLQKELNMNTTDLGGRTALQWACLHGHTDLVFYLLKYDRVNVNQQDHFGNTALHNACCTGHIDIISDLLQHKRICGNIENVKGRTALAWASSVGHTVVVAELLKFDTTVNVNHHSVHGNTALLLAACNGHLNTVCELLKSDKIDPNLEDGDGQTALLVACWHGHTGVVVELLKHKTVNVNHRGTKYGCTALQIARFRDRREIECELMKQETVIGKNVELLIVQHHVNGRARTAVRVVKS